MAKLAESFQVYPSESHQIVPSADLRAEQPKECGRTLPSFDRMLGACRGYLPPQDSMVVSGSPKRW